MTRGPLIIPLDVAENPADAAPITPAGLPETSLQGAFQTIGGASQGSWLERMFWRLLGAVLTALMGLAFWGLIAWLMAQNPIIGWAMGALLGALGVIALVLILRELAALARLGRISKIRAAADHALATGLTKDAQIAAARLLRLYAARPELAPALARLSQSYQETTDGPALLMQAERDVLAPIDTAAQAEIEAAARQVATLTALVPLALADIVTALTLNLRLIRRLSDLYGGRSGALGSLRLIRAVITHLVATGAVALGDDMLGSLVGGGLLSKLSRRFGEGVVNGALTARVGLAAMEVLRPIPFTIEKRPSVSGVIKRALTGLFTSA
jgi:putative membrane protein